MKRLALLLSAVLLTAACGGRNEEGLNNIAADSFAITADTAARRDITQDLLLNGNIKAWEEATIFPRVEGKLTENVLKEGDAVKRNQTIALIERDEVGAVYEPVVVPSTITGVIGKTYLDPGASVTKSTPVALVVNQEFIRIIVEVPERYLGKLKLNQKASFTVEAYDNKTFDAEIYKISPVVDVASRAVTVELKAQNKDGLLKSGMFAKVQLIFEEQKNALSVLATNIQTDEAGQSTVFVINPDGQSVAQTPVQVGLKGNMYEEITSGLAEGQQIANIVFGLKDGSKITLADK